MRPVPPIMTSFMVEFLSLIDPIQGAHLHDRPAASLVTARVKTRVAPSRSLRQSAVEPLGKEAIDLRIGHKACQPGEAALRLQLLSGVHEPGPRRQRQRAADADASDAHRREGFDAQADVTNDQEVEGSWRYRGDKRLDLRRRLRTRSEEHVCARCDVRLQTPDALAQGIWMPHVIALGSSGEQHVLA